MCEDQEANRIREVITQPSYLGSLVKGVLEELKLVTKKTLQNSDVQKRQSRLFIPIADVHKNLVPFLSLEERRDASLLDLTTKKRKRDDERSSGTDNRDRKRKQMDAGRNHGGLEVRLIAGVREIGMQLTKWDSTQAVVLKGRTEWKDIVTEQNLQKGDIVELWAFRRSATELCFELRKIDSRRGGNTAAVEQAPESLPACSVLQNGANLTSKISIAGAVAETKEKAFDENGLNLELTLGQPGSENGLYLELTLGPPGSVPTVIG